MELENQLKLAGKERLEKASNLIHLVYEYKDIVDTHDLLKQNDTAEGNTSRFKN